MLYVVVYYLVGELVTSRELALGGLKPGVDRVLRVRSATLQAAAKVGGIRRSDEHLHRLGHRRANLPRALHLDLEHDRAPLRQPALDLGAKRPVAVAAEGRELEEVAGLDAAVELVAREEVIVAPVLLPGARLAGRCRD